MPGRTPTSGEGGEALVVNCYPGRSSDPASPPKKRYNMFVLVMGVILNACIIGSVASLLAATDSEAAQLKRKRDNMLRFMRDNKVPVELSDRILQYVGWWRGRGEQLTNANHGPLPHCHGSLPA